MSAHKASILEVSRFLFVALLGLIIDVSFALLLITKFGFLDIPAAGAGLLAGMIFNYFMHLKWTFRNHQRKASAKHFTQFSIGVGITLLVRILVLEGIDVFGWRDLLPAFVRLSVSAGVSFTFSYMISRIVFSGRPESCGTKLDMER